jgi:hypothetical protein
MFKLATMVATAAAASTPGASVSLTQ